MSPKADPNANKAANRLISPIDKLVKDEAIMLHANLDTLSIASDTIGSNSIYDGSIDGLMVMTVEGSNTIQIKWRDPYRQILNALHPNFSALTFQKGRIPRWGSHMGHPTLNVLDQPGQQSRAGLSFQICNIDKQGDNLTVTWEDEVVWMLRCLNANNAPMKAVRGGTRAGITRAQFLHQMLKRTLYGDYFICPEENIVQRVYAPGDLRVGKNSNAHPTIIPTPRANRSISNSRQPGFNRAQNVKVKGVKANKSQLRNLEVIISVGKSRNAPDDVIVAAIMAATQESTVREGAYNNKYNPPRPEGEVWGLFQMDNAKGTAAQRKDPVYASNWFYLTAMPIYRANTPPKSTDGMTPAQLCELVERSGNPQAYGQWEAEARKTLKEYNGTSIPNSIVRSSIYQFTVGPPHGPVGETYWEAMQRMASEVNWRCFCVDGYVYFMSEEWLAKSKPIMVISEGDDGIRSIDFSMDHSPKGETKLTVKAESSSWIAPTGTIVMVTDQGIANGRWLVHEISKPLFGDDVLTITLSVPMRKRAEEEAKEERVNLATGLPTTGSGNGLLDKLYKYAEAIDRKQLPYVWGGGHAKLGVPDRGQNGSLGDPQAKGYDCSGAISALLGKIGWLSSPQDTFGLMKVGEPGKGKHFTFYVNAEHVFAIFETPNGGKQRWAAEHRGTIVGWQPYSIQSGYQARHIPGL